MDEMEAYPLRRVVITGLGIVAPNGIGKEACWQAMLAGQSGIRRISLFDASDLAAQVAGEVTDFVPQHYGLTPGEVQGLDRGAQLALAAASLALQDARLPLPLSQQERERTGIYIGTAMACVAEGESLWRQATDIGEHAPYLADLQSMVPTQFTNQTAAGSIAHHYQLHGPSLSIATGCSAGADAIGEAFWLIQEGRADSMLAGGSDSSLSPSSINVFCVIGALSTAYNHQPARASRPYDQDRDGFVMAEGAALLFLEERTHALERGAHIYAEILAFHSNSNAYHMTALPPDGMPLQRLIRQVLDEQKLAPEEINYINAHGSSTLYNDRAETAAYKAVFGPTAYTIPISATKSMIGHTQGAASAIEALVTTLVLDQQIIPPTINLDQADPLCDLDYVANSARAAHVNLALTHSSGFGGVNNALLLARADWEK